MSGTSGKMIRILARLLLSCQSLTVELRSDISNNKNQCCKLMSGLGEKGVSMAQSTDPGALFLRLALHLINLSVILNEISVCIGQSICSIWYKLFGKR